MTTPEFVRYNDEEWSALYKDGKLVVVGDAYLSDEYLSNFLKVKELEGSDYFLGKEKILDSVAQTLEEIQDYLTGIQSKIDAKLKAAHDLRVEADKLEAEAEEIEESVDR